MAILITIIVVVVVLAAAGFAWSAQSKRKLRASFGPEVQTVAEDQGSARQVDRELRRRKKEHDALQLRAISPQQQENYATSWEHVQGEFLDDPALALVSSEKLVANVLEARGYPGGDAQEQLALLSVEYADSLAAYRDAQQVSRRASEDPRNIPTEELRQAMLAYLTLFNELLADSGAGTASAEEINDPASSISSQEAGK